MINSTLYVTVSCFYFSIFLSLLSFQIYNPLYILGFQQSYFDLLSLSWHWIFLALTHGNWLSFKQSPRTSVTVASSCEKLWLIFLPSLSGPRKSWTILRLPDLDPRRVYQSFSYKSTACGKGGILSHKSILNSWSSTFLVCRSCHQCGEVLTLSQKLI